MEMPVGEESRRYFLAYRECFPPRDKPSGKVAAASLGSHVKYL